MAGEDNKQVTIYDVARVAGVSASTVSRTFARPGRVSFTTAQKIKQVAVELGYRAVEMRVSAPEAGQRHGTIALVIADITNPVNFELIRGAEEEAARHGYTMLLAHTRESAIVEREALERVLVSVDGIVLSSSRMSDSGIRAMAKQKPTLVINRGVTGVASVVSDNARGMRRAIEHLGELGHRDIAYLAGPEASWAHGMRWRAMKEGAHELGLNPIIFESPAPTREGGEAIAESVLAAGATAVVAYNDLLALGFMERAKELGRDIPGDISVVGFDNSLFSGLTNPGLTSVAAPLHAMGAAGVRNLLGMASNTMADPFRPVVLPTRLVVRGSTAPPPN